MLQVWTPDLFFKRSSGPFLNREAPESGARSVLKVNSDGKVSAIARQGIKRANRKARDINTLFLGSPSTFPARSPRRPRRPSASSTSRAVSERESAKCFECKDR